MAHGRRTSDLYSGDLVSRTAWFGELEALGLAAPELLHGSGQLIEANAAAQSAQCRCALCLGPARYGPAHFREGT